VELELELDVKRKLSEGQCSGDIFSDHTVDEAARAAAANRQLAVVQLQRQSGKVCHSSHVCLMFIYLY